MQQRNLRHASDISKQVAEFGQGLQNFSQRLEQDVAELKRVVACKPRPGRMYLLLPVLQNSRRTVLPQ